MLEEMFQRGDIFLDSRSFCMMLEEASAGVGVGNRVGLPVNCRLERTGPVGDGSALQAGKHLSNVHLLTLTYMASGSTLGPRRAAKLRNAINIEVRKSLSVSVNRRNSGHEVKMQREKAKKKKKKIK